MEPGQEVIVRDNRTNIKLFGGYIKDVTRKFVKKDLYFESCRSQDYSKLIANVTDGVTADYTAGTSTEKAILTALFAAYCPTISVGSHVITGNNTAINFENSSLRRAIDELAAVEGRKWCVDSDKRLHYFANTGEAAPFGLSDSPDNSTTYSYGNLEYTTDENSDVTGTLKCWQPGLYAGMAIAITCAKIGWAAQSYLITEVVTRLISGSLANNDIEAEYTVSFGTILKSQISNEIIRSGRVITDARIASCSIDKLIAGDLTATGTISSTGSFVTGASGTNRIEITSAKVAGINSADVEQFYLQASDGKAYCAGGNIIFDVYGITVKGASGSINIYGVDGITSLGSMSNGGTNTSIAISNSSTEGRIVLTCTKYLTLRGYLGVHVEGAYLSLPTSTTATASEGYLYYDSVNHLIKYHNGTAWKTIATV